MHRSVKLLTIMIILEARVLVCLVSVCYVLIQVLVAVVYMLHVLIAMILILCL